MHRSTLLASFVFGSLFAIGCGGSTSDAPSDESDTGDVADSSTTDSATTTDSTTTTDSATTTDSGTTTTDSGTTTTDSGTTTTDAKGIDCGGKTCGAEEVCCASGGSGGATFTCTKGACADGGATIACDGPEDCSGGKVCCAKVEVTGTGVSCSYKSGVAECAGECKSMLPAGCPGTATVRPCHAAADCTETGYKNCCTISGMGSSATFCGPDYLKLVPSAKCL